MGISTIDAGMLKNAFLAGAKGLEAKKDWINELNVFPVPDGDTGTNMTLTIMAAAREVAELENPTMDQLAKAISSGSLRGARGNSGVILSQLLRGFTKEIKAVEEIDTTILANAMVRGTETAYKAVMKPKEGTILTVAKAMADKGLEMASQTDDMEEFVKEVIEYGDYVLGQTPEMLPVLKQAGVVDSGGQGLMQVVKGAVDGLLGKTVDFSLDTVQDSRKTPAAGAGAVKGAARTDIDTSDIKFGYCTEFIINLEKDYTDKDEAELKSYLESIGDSIVCVADEEIVKIHVHTNDPGLAIQKALTYGSLTRMKIDNMREEHHERVIKNASEMAKQQKQEEKKVEFKENGFISVSVGDGLTDLFHELGVDEVIEGGQTMNPSTEDILGAIEKIPAKNIYILPNNGNIILAAQQAKDLTKDKAVHVIPTKNIPQGIAAMINFVEGFTPEQNEEAMTEALSEVKSGQVTYAVRDTVIDGKEIKAGNIMGLSDKTIEIVGTDVVDTTIDLLKKMMDEESELITIYYGEEGTKEDAEKIAKAIEGIDDEMEVEIQYGGQPIYYYFVSVE